MLSEFEAIQWCKEHHAKVEWTASHTILTVDGFFDTIVAKTVQEAVELAINIEKEFTETRQSAQQTIPNPSWLPDEDKLAAIEEGLDPNDYNGFGDYAPTLCHCGNDFCSGCTEDRDMLWIPGPAELETAEAELAVRELEESQHAYAEMAEDETAALKAELTHGSYFL